MAGQTMDLRYKAGRKGPSAYGRFMLGPCPNRWNVDQEGLRRGVISATEGATTGVHRM